MLINCFGSLSAPLYWFSEFFESKPVAHLLGGGIQAAHLNDDHLGRVLDGLSQCGTTMFFLKVAMQAMERFKVTTEQVHLDSSSFSVDGDYPTPEEMDTPDEQPACEADAHPISICRGYSRDQRLDLKQFIVNLICAQDGGVPLWFKVANGNQSDAQAFSGIMGKFSSQWHLESMFVAELFWENLPPEKFRIDEAFYSEPNLQSVSPLQQIFTAALDESRAFGCPLSEAHREPALDARRSPAFGKFL
jgi:transposase